MKRESSAKKLSLISVLTMLLLIAIVVAGTSQTRNRPSTIPSIPSNSTIAEHNETIEPEASEQVNEVNNESIGPEANEHEENTVIAIKPSSGNEVQDARGDSNVSRGAKNTYIVSTPARNDASNFWQNRQAWLQPVKGRQVSDPTGGARYFGAPRTNGRAHAAIDFIAPGGTLVYAMTDGKVIRTSVFFQNTSAVEVQNTDGTIARYCEIAPSVSVNTIVQRGDVIGKIITNYAGTSMLHLEMYIGTASGSLSQGNNSSNYKYVTVRNYERRSDLINPTGAIYLPVR